MQQKASPPKTPTNEEKLAVITAYVKKWRKKLKIKKLDGARPETSYFANGEFKNLLWCGLMNRPESEWVEMKDQEILDGVYGEVVFRPKKSRC